MEIKRIVLGRLWTNCYILINGDCAIVIDPACNENKIFNELGNYKVKGILLTHGHFDHIGAIDALRKKYGCKVYCHIDDEPLLNDSRENGSDKYCAVPITIEDATYFDYQVNIEGFDITVIHTPGHTKGSCSYLVENKYLFSGDFLFKEVIGRTDYTHSSNAQMKNSCKMIKKYSKELIVYPGHGDISTMEHELKCNPYLR